MSTKGLSPIALAAARHYQEQGRQEIAIPEWGDGEEPLLIYASPMTLKEGQRLLRAIRREGELPAMADCLIMKAQKEDGSPAFSLIDKQILLTKVDQNVIRRVADRITQGAPIGPGFGRVGAAEGATDPAEAGDEEDAEALLARETAVQAGN